ELPEELVTPQPENRTAQYHVLAPAQLRMKPRAQYEQTADAAVQIYRAARRLRDATEHLQQRRFAGAVASDDADGFARPDAEADIVERVDHRAARRSARPEAARHRAHHVRHRVAQRSVTRLHGADRVLLGDVVDGNHRAHGQM